MQRLILMDAEAPLPLQAEHHLDGHANSVTLALEHTRRFLRRCRPALAETSVHDILLVVSELVTNAVRHAPGPCTLNLAYRRREVTIDVSDTSPAPPVPRPADLRAATGGLGWNIILALAHHVDVCLHQPPRPGKTITATVRPVLA